MRAFQRVNGYDAERKVKYGLKGACDIYGWLRGGQAFEIECKTGSGELKPNQILWRDFCLWWPIPWYLAQDTADGAVQFVEELLMKRVEDVERAL